MKTAKLALLSLFLVALNGPIVAAEPDAVSTSVNINEASAAEMAERLTGIGEERAAAIVEYREIHGPFQSVEDLVEVRGVGDAILSANASRIKL